MSILKDYYRLQKFNVMTLANEKNEVESFQDGTGRVKTREHPPESASPGLLV